MFRKIFDAFPTPKFLSFPYAGVSISDTSVRCIQFGRKNNGLFIEKYAEKKIPLGVVVSGQVNNKDELVRILKELKKELNLEYVKVSLPEEKAYLFTAKIPIVKRGEVVSAIESKIEENVPVPPGELIFDYRLIDHRKTGHLDVVVSTMPISLVDVYVSIAEEAGLKALSLEIESQAIARSVVPTGSLGTSLIVHFCQDKVGLYVVSDRLVRFTSTISTKGEVGSSQDFLSQEIKKLYVYWHTLKENVDKPEKKIEQIIICGEKFDDSTVSYLSAHNHTKVSLGNVWTNVFDVNTNVPEITFSDSLKYSAVVGLALPSEVLIYNNHV